VVVNSTFRDLKHSAENRDPSLESAVTSISTFINSSENPAAAQSWDRFLKELSGKKSKSKLASCWHQVVKLVPDVSKLVESVSIIAKLFT
jgi:hypothetical protein